MEVLRSSLIADLIANENRPQLTIYQKVHRRYPQIKADRIEFKNLLTQAEVLLEQAGQDPEPFLAPLRNFETDESFWQHQLDGLALFVTVGWVKMFKLPYSVESGCVLADKFFLKPFLPFASDLTRYQILTVSQDIVALYQGGQFHIEELALASEVPSNLIEALGAELTEPYLVTGSHSGRAGQAIHHGHGGRREEKEIDIDRFLRVIDRAVWKHHSEGSKLPLIVAALPEYISRFVELSHNPHLLEEGIAGHPHELDKERLRNEAWQLISPKVEHDQQTAISTFQASKQFGKSADDLDEVAKAALAGRVETLFIEEGRSVPGKIEIQGAKVAVSLSDRNPNDLLDDIAKTVMRAGGRIFVLPTAQMPTDMGVAATFRY